MKIKLYKIDAFTDKLFGGNPAAVCCLDNWIESVVMQQIAMENNLPETAFFVKQSDNTFQLRWFTPQLEMDLCGHATLAAAFVIFEKSWCRGNRIMFETKSGKLSVSKANNLLEIDFPSRPPQKADLPCIINNGLNIKPREIWKSRDYLLLYDNEDDVINLKPDIAILGGINIDPGGIIVTAKGKSENVDFVSRFFTPQADIFEDPVTGSAHCTLIPFWAERLNKTKLKALQLSKRGGELFCKLEGERVKIAGKAVKYSEGIIYI